MMLTLTQLTVLIGEARTAYHALMTGSAVTLVRDQNGEEVRYTQANSGSLSSYIDDLQRQIDAVNGVCTPVLGPMRVFF